MMEYKSVFKKIPVILKLIRWQNLAIIVLTQFLLRFGILNTFLFQDHPGMMSGLLDFSLLVAATVFLTAGGYLINDYFDTRIDSINRPARNPVGNAVKASSVILAHIIVNGIAILIGFYLAYRLRSLNFGLVFPFVTMLLWLYSARYKRMLAWGNLIVAILSAMVVFMVWYFEFLHLRLHPADFSQVVPELKQIAWYFAAFGLFAFLVSLFREVIKDMEDIPGDKRIRVQDDTDSLWNKKVKPLRNLPDFAHGPCSCFRAMDFFQSRMDAGFLVFSYDHSGADDLPDL
jgi:4-hydroxybenzoate polyprenyltransferase